MNSRHDVVAFRLIRAGRVHLVTNHLQRKTRAPLCAIVREELDKHPDFELTHEHLNDGTVAGMRMKSKNCFSVQYHPEASPGLHDSSYLFDQFIENIKTAAN